MVKRKRKTTRTTRRKTTKRRSTKKKPIGFTKVGGKYAFVVGTRKNPKLAKGRYSSKKTLANAYAKKYA